MSLSLAEKSLRSSKRDRRKATLWSPDTEPLAGTLASSSSASFLGAILLSLSQKLRESTLNQNGSSPRCGTHLKSSIWIFLTCLFFLSLLLSFIPSVYAIPIVVSRNCSDEHIHATSKRSLDFFCRFLALSFEHFSFSINLGIDISPHMRPRLRSMSPRCFGDEEDAISCAFQD